MTIEFTSLDQCQAAFDYLREERDDCSIYAQKKEKEVKDLEDKVLGATDHLMEQYVNCDIDLQEAIEQRDTCLADRENIRKINYEFLQEVSESDKDHQKEVADLKNQLTIKEARIQELEAQLQMANEQHMDLLVRTHDFS